jgi:pimeloyl-ACP methyl ester carboxylesterase
VLLEGAGHWTQQERPDEVSERLVAFCRGVPR